MRKKISNEMLEKALDEIKRIVDASDGRKLPKEYDGYAASFGPAVITSGLLPAVAFYSDEKKKKRKKFTKVIATVCGYPTTNLLQHVKDSQERAKLKKEILQATVAIKLAMRNFPHTDSETENS